MIFLRQIFAMLAIAELSQLECYVHGYVTQDDMVLQNHGLYEFYVALGGPGWIYREVNTQPWIFEEGRVHDPCVEQWAGVGCSGEGMCSEYGQCVVRSIILEEYNLTGSIPTSFIGLGALEVLDIGYNSVAGMIPHSIGQLANITSLSFGINSLVGRLPESLEELSHLEEFDIIGNMITGHIPSFHNSVDSMINLYVGENDLTGTIPESILRMTNLEYIYFTQNKLNGTIPFALGQNLNSLYYLGLSTNAFSGTLPSSMGSLSELRYLMLNKNHLDGTLPESIGQLTNLEFFEVNFNYFSGPIPSSFGNLVNMFALEICENFINGTLPSSLGQLSVIDTLYLDSNLISGQIPKEIGLLSNLTGLLLYDNRLTGTIPSSLGILDKLEELSLYKNRLSGYIPESITAMSELKELLLQINLFEGFECLRVYGSACRFDMPNLQRLDVSDNRLEGTVPMQIFHLPSLRSVALVNGCFHGKLKDDICLATNLEVLSLDGLTSSEDCRKNTFFPFELQSGYVVKHSMSGSLPDCVWNMPNLTVLHVAGNGLTGSLPAKLPLFSKLINISVAYNKITGTIPDTIQDYPFVEVCLAYNKLSGDLSSSTKFSDNGNTDQSDASSSSAISARRGSVLSVEVNRLTGFTPDDFENVLTLNSLNGNFFNCDQHHPLPSNDEESSYYICGSKNLDQSLAVWTVLLAIIATFVCIVTVVRLNLSRKSVNFRVGDARNIPEIDESDSVLAESLLRDELLSLHTSPGSFDAYADDEGLLKPCQSSKHRVQYLKDRYEASAATRFKMIFIDIKDSVNAHVSQWIMWFQCTTQEDLSIVGFENNSKSTIAGELYDVKVFVSLLCMIRRSAILVTSIIVIVCTPLYCLLKLVWGNKFSTHEHQYGWLVSCAFLAGLPPSICLLLIFLFLCCILAFSLVLLYPASVTDVSHFVRLSMLSFPRDSGHINMTMKGPVSTREPLRTDLNSPASSLSQHSYMSILRGRCTLASENAISKKRLFTRVGIIQFLAFFLIFLLNVLITLSVNVLYVYGFDTSTHYYVRVSMKVVLATFQITWNMIVVPKTIEYFAKKVNNSSRTVKWLITLCLSFNYIIAPAIAGILSSSTCFADYFKDQPSVVSFYEYDVCRAYSLDVTTNTRYCNEMTTASFSTSFIPPFMYYYQCSSTLITSYVPILMLEHAILVVLPISIVLGLSHKAAARYVPDFFVRVVPSIVWPPQYRPRLTQMTNFTGAIIRPHRVIAAFMGHFGVLITYGLASPFLACAICIAMSSLTILAQILIGRYLFYYQWGRTCLINENADANCASDQREDTVRSGDELNTEQPLQSINMLCVDILDGLPNCLWTILLVAAVFVCGILIDIAGDETWWGFGLLVGLSAFVAPFLAFGTHRFTLYCALYL